MPQNLMQSCIALAILYIVCLGISLAIMKSLS